MLIMVDPSSGVPVFRQIMDQVRLHIASGSLSAGDELPPTRALSAELGVNPMTISKAYSLLERGGLLERRPGRPLVVKAAGEDEMKRRKIDEVKARLTETVRIVVQLGVDPEEAVAVFRELLDDSGGAPDRGRGKT